ncbi:MAG TPA: DUF4097 family beta strand repeat-containing protein [Bryobacteraceae bacterium]|nr:DUF4097 family beta strand repeat-containing protein [Bryobacteraceae bacterium]
MKKTIAILFVCAGTLFAQDGGERVNVPLTDPSRPARVHAHLLMGGITVRGGNTREVVVEMRPKSGSEPHEAPVPPKASGMHRLDLPGNAGLDITEQDNTVNIKTTAWNRHGDLMITVPRHSSLQLKTINDGDIDVEQVDGEIDADALNGRITLKNIAGSVLAHALNGPILVTLDQVDPAKPMSFSTLNGDIDVTLPDNVKANVRMKTDNGEIYSDFEVKLDSGSNVTTNNSDRRDHGAYHIRLDRTFHGTINGGGPEYQFTSFNGQIFIRKKK